MKKLLITLFTAVAFFAQAQQTVNLSMGASYANDIYYSFAGGEIKTEPALNWDLAFTVRPLDVSIIINEGKGVSVYVVSDGINDWNAIDTSGMRQRELHNSTESWEFGALSNMGTSHPDYGWGEYNQITHNVNAKRIFVLELADGSYKKLIIDEMTATGQEFNFRLADLDGSNEVMKSGVKTDYAGKNFFYYSVADDQFLDREPISSEWDIVFRRYSLPIQAGPAIINYIVMGAQTNLGIRSARIQGAIPAAADSVNYTLDNTDISRIGSDWKNFSMATFQWNLTDSLSYFVTSKGGRVYQLFFSAFGGSATGDISLSQNRGTSIGMEEEATSEFSIFPNPANNFFTIQSKNSSFQIALLDISGRTLIEKKVENQTQTQLNVSSLPSGSYFVRITSENKVSHLRLILAH